MTPRCSMGGRRSSCRHPCHLRGLALSSSGFADSRPSCRRLEAAGDASASGRGRHGIPEAGSTLGNPAEAIARELEALHHATVTALAHDDFTTALQSVIDAEKVNPANPDVQKDVDLILQAAARDVDRRFQRKSAILLDTQSIGHFQAASTSRRDASRLRSSGRKIEAIQALLAARSALAKTNPAQISSAAEVKNGPAQPNQPGTASPIENPPPVDVPPPIADPGGRTTKAGAESPTTSTTSIPPVTQPPKPDPLPALTPKMSDRAMIDGVLKQYISAYEHQDATALRRVWPTMPEDLRSMIAQNRSYRITLTDVEIKIQGDSATVA